MNSNPNPPDADPIQQTINRLVEGFKHHQERLPQVCRELCRVAQQHHLGPEDFRRRLVRAGLSGPRASELKAVFQNKDHLEPFLRAATPESWRNTLVRVRADARQAAFGSRPTKAELILAQMAGWMHRGGLTRFSVGEFELVLTDSPATPFELLEARP